MVRWLINTWRDFVSRHARWSNEPGSTDEVFWETVLKQADELHNKVAENAMPHPEKQYNTSEPFIRELFSARDDAHKECTAIILEALTPTLITAVLEFFQLNHGDVQWIHVSIHDPDMLALVGTISDTAQVDEKQIAEVPQVDTPRYLRVGIPVKVVETGTKDTILDYFRKVQDTEAIAEKKQLALLSEQVGFDLAALTEDQRERLIMTMGVSENKTQQ